MRHEFIRKGSLESSGRQEAVQTGKSMAQLPISDARTASVKTLVFAPFRRGLVVERSDLLSGGAYYRGVGMVYVICVSDLGKDGFHGCFKDVREWARFTHHCFFTCAIMN